MDDDDFFDDNDLDDLPDNTLQQLEQHALTSTQRSTGVSTSTRQHLRAPVYPESSLGRVHSARSKLPWRPPLPQNLRLQQHVSIDRQSATPVDVPNASASDDYGLEDEDVIDLDGPGRLLETNFDNKSNSINHAQATQSTLQHPLDEETKTAFAAADLELAGEGWSHAPHLQAKSYNDDNNFALRARIAQLEKEHTLLKLSEQQAREAATSKQGEIAIVRANQDNLQQKYEQQIAVMQQLHADQAARLKSELDMSRKEKEKIQIDNRFLQHDLAQESERVKRVNVSSITKHVGTRTPRKTIKRTDLGDGFEDGEAQGDSPSKNRDKSREQTPKAGSKRKRLAQDSPIAALSFTAPSLPTRQETNESMKLLESRDGAASSTLEHEQYVFMQRMLLHVPREGHERTIEALSRYALPSCAKKPLSSMLIEQVMLDESPANTPDLPIRLANVVLGLWSRCLQDKYYRPLYLLLSLVRYALYFEPPITISLLAECAVPLCLKSIDLVVVVQFKAMGGVTKLDEDLNILKRDIDVSAIMSFLMFICEASSLIPEAAETFWKHWDPQQALLGLSRVRSMEDLVTSLRMLATSARLTSWGPVALNPEEQHKQEIDLLDRVTLLLFETPQPPSDEVPYDDVEIAGFRLEILALFKSMCITDHGCLLFAEQHNAIGRLILFLNNQVNTLYNVAPSSTHPPYPGQAEDTRPSIHDLVVQSVNNTVKLIQYILNTHDAVNIVQKLQPIHGGYHKFLVSMTRIAFSEQLVFERGIEDEVVEAAHSLLDDVLSPAEGEAVVKAVETPKGTRNTRSARATSVDAMIVDANGDTSHSNTTMSFPV